MSMDPSKLGFARQVDFIGVNSFSGYTGGLTYVSAGNGLPVLTQVGTTGMAGLLMEDDNDEVSHLMKIPTYWNLHQPVKTRVVFSSAAAVAEAITFTIEFTGLLVDSTVVAAPATAIAQTADTTIGVANTLQATALTVVTQSLLFNVTTNVAFDYLGLMLVCTDQNADATVYGLEFEYAPRWGLGIGQDGQVWNAGVRGS